MIRVRRRSDCAFVFFQYDLAFTAAGDGIVVGERTDSASGTSTQALVSAVTGQFGTVMDRITVGLGQLRGGGGVGGQAVAGGFMLYGSSGLSGGDGARPPLGAWISYAHSELEDDFELTAYDADRDNVLGGVDVLLADRIMAGVSFGYETADYDTRFNDGEQETDGTSVVPYLAVLLNDTFNVNVLAGFSDLETDQFRTDPVTSARVVSSFDSDRVFWGASLTGTRSWDPWYASVTLGYLWAEEDQEAFLESDGTTVPAREIQIGQYRIGGELGYDWRHFEPYLSATYERNYRITEIVVPGSALQPANDRDDVLFGLGVRYYHPAGVTGSVGWSKRLGREDFDEDVVDAYVRVTF